MELMLSLDQSSLQIKIANFIYSALTMCPRHDGRHLNTDRNPSHHRNDLMRQVMIFIHCKSLKYREASSVVPQPYRKKSRSRDKNLE